MPIPPNNRVPVPVPVPVPVAKKSSASARKVFIGVAVTAVLLLLLLLLILASPKKTGTAGNQPAAAENAAGTASEKTDDEQGTDKKQTDAEKPEAEQPASKEPTAIAETAEAVAKESEVSTASEKSDTAQKETAAKNNTSELIEEAAEEYPEPAFGGIKSTKPKETKPSKEQGDGITVSVFGTKGQGTKFVYVFDRSGSMSGNPIQTAKEEMIQSIASLDERHQFNIIFYDNNQLVWQNKGKLISATPSKKEDAENFIKSITAGGGTEHLQPLLAAMQYKPDVIFFLTDGQSLTNDDLEQISGKSGTIHINVIEFGSGYRKSEILRQLAIKNSGQYRYINVTDLDAL